MPDRRRTTPRLIEVAIAGVQGAGLPIKSVEVQGGGIVRILFEGAESTADIKEGNSCDEVFEARSG